MSAPRLLLYSAVFRAAVARFFAVAAITGLVTGQQLSQPAKAPRPGTLRVAEKIHPALRGAMSSADYVAVFLILNAQPQREIYQRQVAANAFRSLTARTGIRDAQTSSDAQTLEEAQAQLRQVLYDTRQAAFQEIAAAISPGQDALEQRLSGLGARRIHKYRAINMMAAELPGTALPSLELDPEIAEIAPVRRRDALLATSVPALGATTFWSHNVTGKGQSVAILDSGVRTNHPAFAGVNIVSQVFLTNAQTDPCFADNPNSAEDQEGHGTHVAGITASQGESPTWTAYQGVAKGMQTLYNIKIAFLESSSPSCSPSFLQASAYDGDTLDGIDWVIQNTPDTILNYSYGAPATGGDDPLAQAFDQLIDVYDLTLTVAAGNSGTIQSPGIAYNIVSVGNWVSRGVMNSSSGRGPTLDGRDKPDLAAPGTNIYSTAFDWDGGTNGSNPDFVPHTGTSMAAPHIAGSAALIKSAFAAQTPPANSLAAKALLINTTDNAGWVDDSGWGYTNLTTAWNEPYFALDSVTASGAPGSYRFYRIAAPGQLRATVTWNRHISGSTSEFNDIDLLLYSAGDGSLLSASQSPNQNVEQVSSTASGDMIAEVQMTSAPLAGVSAEPYGIAFSSPYTSLKGPALTLSCTAPAAVGFGQAFQVSCRATNNGDLAAFNANAAATLPAGFTGANTFAFGTVAAGATTLPLTVTITAPPAASGANIPITLTSNSWGLSFTANATVPVLVEQETVTAPATPSGPASGFTGPSYMYTTGGSASNVGNPLQYMFTWGDGTNSGWLSAGATSASHTWSTSGAYSVRAQARSAMNPSVLSSQSTALAVAIQTAEMVSTPAAPTGPGSASIGTAQTYSTGGSTSNLGNPVQYMFTWGDGASSGWLAVGTTSASHAWSSTGGYNVRAQARSATSTSIVSAQSNALAVTVQPAETVSTPAAPTGPASASIGIPQTYSTSSSTSNLGNAVQYMFTWGDGTNSGWLAVGTTSAPHSWSIGGAYSVRAQARSAVNTSVVSAASAALTVTIPASANALGFFPVTPCRTVDTRASQGKTGAFGPPSLSPYAGRDFPLTSSGCGLPPAAQAYALNFTVVPSGPLDFLTAWPAAKPFPGISTLNSPDGSTLANAAIVPAGSNGAITVTAGNPTDAIIDANGYFAPPNGSELAFYPVTPCRVADTRASQGKTGAFGPPSLQPYTGRDFPVTTSACGIPPTALAYSVNMTVVPQGRLDFLSAWPAGKPFPAVSTLNSPDGSTVANAAIIPAGTNGAITVTAGNATDFILDINGYFGPPNLAGALHFYAVTPCRVADTRASQGKTGAFGPPSLQPYTGRDFPILSSGCNVPPSAQAYGLNITVVPQGPLDFLTAWPAGKPFPPVSTLNAPKGGTLANMAIVPAGTNGAISVTAGNPTDVIIDVNGYFAP